MLALFRRLEGVPLRRRKSDQFRAEERQLHRLLHVYADAMCSSTSVLDREPRQPGYYPAEATYREAMRVHAVRLALLEALKEAAPVG